MPVTDLLSRMSSGEFTYWLAYEQIHPRIDLWHMFGTLMATLCNLWSKGRYRAQDFMPKVARLPPKEQSTDQQIAILHSLARLYGPKPK